LRKFSIIIPVYNRPDEVDELLDSLTKQSQIPFEILIIEDGSSIKCDEIVRKYENSLPIRYLFKENSGQGFSRNYGFEQATGDYFIVFDSDCIIPEDYFRTVEEHLNKTNLDAYGGPDAARDDFTSIQKAISYSMTSPLTTGGIRGRKKHAGQFHPRSFNLGMSREVFESTKGYRITRMGEDIELSIRIIESGFKTGLIKEAFVYHKRRTSFSQFFKQLRFFGRARINVSRFYPKEIKLIHLLPLFFLLGEFSWIVWSFFDYRIFILGLAGNVLFSFLNFVFSLFQFRNLWVSLLSIIASYIQLLSYGTGLLTEGVRKIFAD
jgi:glycosyltransferase involved in cell wall biosynthesis